MKILEIRSKKNGIHSIYFDDKDEEFILSYSWHISKKGKRGIFYAQTSIKREARWRTFMLHRLLLGISDPKIFIDHEDHNGLNNQRYNLRVSTVKQNCSNQRTQLRTKSSLYKGVYLTRNVNPWRAHIMVNRRDLHLGYYAIETDAALAYNEAALKYFGEFANLNPIP